MINIAATAKIYPNVQFGANITVGDFCIIGIPFKDYSGQTTLIGDNAIIRSHTVIYAGNQIGKNFHTGHHVMLREENEIGDGVSIGTGTVVEHHVRINNGVRIHSQVFIPEFCILHEDCWIGPRVVLTNAKYPNRPDTKRNLQGVTIGKQAVIGANVTILPGVYIGANAVVGAGSVVAKNIPDGVIVHGEVPLVIK
jgi:acetyltransferase-like isoleucine patch superfamily enzyme